MAVQASRTTQPHRPARAFAPSRGILQDIVVEHVALMRYAAQSDALPVPFAMPLDTGVLEALVSDLADAYEGAIPQIMKR